MTRPVVPTRLASVYILPDAFVVVANHRTQAGFWLGGRPVTRLPLSVSDAELGAATRAALAAGLAGVPTPRRADYPARLRDLAAAAGVRTWAALEKVARLCTVQETASAGPSVVPQRRDAPRGSAASYHELADAAFEAAGDDDAALGAAVRRGIELSL